jgi:hypothetical protein
MDGRTNTPQPAALEEAVASVTRAADEAAALVRVLAPVAGGLPNLQRAIAEFCRSRTPEADAPVLTAGIPAPLPAVDAVAGNGPPESGELDAACAAPESSESAPLASNIPPAPAGMRTVSVIVSGTDGPLDLVRVHSAMDSLTGIRGVTLASYTRNHAVLLLETDLPSATLPLAEALMAAFAARVDGKWLSETDFVATIGAVTGIAP